MSVARSPGVDKDEADDSGRELGGDSDGGDGW